MVRYRRRFRHLLAAVLGAALLSVSAGCARGTSDRPVGPVSADADGVLTVTVSILPQRYFVERIGGAHVNVNVMVGLGAEPHSYEPKPEQMRALSESEVYFSIGVDFEDVWLDKIASTNREMLIVDTIRDIERLPMSSSPLSDEDHEQDGAPDPHVWTSPALVKVQTQAICEALAEIDPAYRDTYQANLVAFTADIDALIADTREALAGSEGAKFLVFHPSWGYFARDFGLEQVPVEVGGQEPSARELASLIAEAKREDIRIVLAQPEFSSQAAEIIAREIDGKVLLISPMDADWLGNLRRVTETFAEELTR